MKKGFITPREWVLSFQHVFAMLGATILVPMAANLNISTTLISAGIGTLIFYFITKRKVPVFLGSSFAFLGALIGQMKEAGDIGSATWNYAMAQLSVAIVCTGFVYVILSLIIKLVGTNFIHKLFPPVVVGPVIIVIGMCLAKSALNNLDPVHVFNGVPFTTTQAVGVILAGITTVLTIVCISIFAKGFFKVVPILFGIFAGYIVAACFHIIDFDRVANNDWILFQPSVFMKSFGWYGSLGKIWNADLLDVILKFVPIAIVTFMEHLGDINASSVVCGKDFIQDPGVHRTLLGDGLATMAAGFLGGPCNTTYGENTAVLAITKNYNPNVLAISAVFAIILGIFTKFGQVLGTIPPPVIGGASLILYGMIAGNGLKTMVEAKTDFTDPRNMMTVSIILVIGIGMNAANYTLDIGGVSFSALAVATFIGIIVNLIFTLGSRKVKLVKEISPDGDGEENSDLSLEEKKAISKKIADTAAEDAKANMALTVEELEAKEETKVDEKATEEEKKEDIKE